MPLTLPTEERRYLGMGDVQIADYAEASSQELAKNVARALGQNRAVLMARHGVLAVGDDPMSALEIAEVVERDSQLENIVTTLEAAKRKATGAV